MRVTASQAPAGPGCVETTARTCGPVPGPLLVHQRGREEHGRVGEPSRGLPGGQPSPLSDIPAGELSLLVLGGVSLKLGITTKAAVNVTGPAGPLLVPSPRRPVLPQEARK